MEPHPDITLTELKANIGKRAYPNLDVVHVVCREIHGASAPNKDFSPSTVGRLTQSRNGPSLNTLLSPGGKHFRTLIHAWAAYSGTDTRRPNYSEREPVKDDIMDAITDPVLRSMVGGKLAELRRVRAELNLLKSKTVGTVDLRPRVEGGPATPPTGDTLTEVVLDVPKLVPAERAALEQVLDEKWRTRAGLRSGANGEVAALRPFRTGEDILPVGFLDAVQALLPKT